MARLVDGITVMTEQEIEAQTGLQLENLQNPRSKQFNVDHAAVVVKNLLGWQTWTQNGKEVLDVIHWCRGLEGAIATAKFLNDVFATGYPAERKAFAIELDADNAT